jgi:hypothetical protein
VKAHAFNSIGRSFRIESAGVCKDKAFKPRQSRKIIKLSQLNGWPAGSPVNASSRISRWLRMTRGPVWFATPFRSRIFTLSLCAVSRRNTLLYFPFSEVTLKFPDFFITTVDRGSSNENDINSGIRRMDLVAMAIANTGASVPHDREEVIILITWLEVNHASLLVVVISLLTKLNHLNAWFL